MTKNEEICNLQEMVARWMKRFEKAEARAERLEAVEVAARTFIEYDGANDELDYLHYGEYFDALKAAVGAVK